jgi:hypothetical protein
MIKSSKFIKILIIGFLIVGIIGFGFIYRTTIDSKNKENTNSYENNNQSDLFEIYNCSTNISISADNLITNELILFNGSFSAYHLFFVSGIGYEIRFNWSFGDNTTYLDYNKSYYKTLNLTTLYSSLNHTYTSPGKYLVNLTIEKRMFYSGATFDKIGFCSKEIIVKDHT